MSTRCNITVKCGDEVETLYHHYDGYPSGVGNELKTFIKTIYTPIYSPTTEFKTLDEFCSQLNSFSKDYERHETVHGDIEYLYEIQIKDESINIKVDAIMHDLNAKKVNKELSDFSEDIPMSEICLGTKMTLKILLEFFEKVISGEKTFEIRSIVDRTFNVGDRILLREWNEESKSFTGRSQGIVVTYVLQHSKFCLENYATFSFKLI